MVARLRIDIVASGRLQPDRSLAEAQSGNCEGPAIGSARQEEWIGFRASPTLCDLLLNGIRQRGEILLVVGQR